MLASHIAIITQSFQQIIFTLCIHLLLTKVDGILHFGGGGVQNQLEELNSDACWSVSKYDASLKLISNGVLQMSENRSS